MNEALKVDVFSFEVGILPEAKKRVYTKTKTLDDGTVSIEEVTYEDTLGDFPFARYVSVFELFPDPANGRPRYVTRRSVVSHKTFKQTFGSLIESPDNLLPKDLITEIVKCLPVNENGADRSNYNNPRHTVHHSRSSAHLSYET